MLVCRDPVCFCWIAAVRGDLGALTAWSMAPLSSKPDVRPRDASGRTAVHYAAEKGFTDIVAQLLRAGASTSHADCDGGQKRVRECETGA